MRNVSSKRLGVVGEAKAISVSPFLFLLSAVAEESRDCYFKVCFYWTGQGQDREKRKD